MLKASALLISAVALAGGCSSREDVHVFSLYANHSRDQAFREHVATFDATPRGGAREGEAWTVLFADDNRANCEKVGAMPTHVGMPVQRSTR